ncbi:hypothetical protein BGP77_11545 [Saccharospirillum sp. MSK14-1]|uniref:hypothetical protein n=1 Tax=Saccharospirillum sp. MSK14-1 TaxID=1897632 RepID=UPI000D38FAB4|nr:hypothetical protein [Saccharospirillum sp. MSK14-1]PTY38574.1 hypothetical protein BGP77_11545 [Saccharospirillum sp. MSK14-1]
MIINPFFYIALAAFVYLMFKVWPDHVVDYYRDKIFTERDKMFRRAVEGEFSFDDPKYQYARAVLNSLLRYAHEFDFYAVFWGMKKAHIRKVNKQPPVNLLFLPESSESEDEVANSHELNVFIMRGIFLMTKLLILRQPLFLPVFLLLAVFYWAKNGFHEIRRSTINSKIERNIANGLYC